MITELDYSVLKRHTNIEDLGDEVKALDDNSLIGQSTGEEALKFGLNVKSKGYNIYVAGANGSGKTSFAEKFAREPKVRNTSIARRGLPVLTKALRTVFPLAVLAGVCYNFCVYFAAEPQLMGQNPALYENVSRLVQFWL